MSLVQTELAKLQKLVALEVYIDVYDEVKAWISTAWVLTNE